MKKYRGWLRDGLLLVAAFGIGWWAHSGRQVQAQGQDVFFQLQSVNSDAALTLYYPGQRAIYVYQGALAGNSELQCNYIYKLDKPGGVVHRQNCAVPVLNPNDE
ncbi:MAG: hypothetical protein ACYC46_02525 [Acidobacteriaceae bacterium]